MNRRQLLAGAAAVVAAGCGVEAERLHGRPKLTMPPLLDTRAKGRLSLTAQAGRTSFLGGAASATVGYNQGYLGPTLVMRNGPLGVDVLNTLHETVTVHWHGLLVPGEHDGSAHQPILPGKRWIVPMQIGQRPATLWYHSHGHGTTARHVYWGLAGVIHQTDGRDDQRGLPSRYGIDDLTLVLQDRRFDDQGRMVYSPDPTDILNGFHGGRMLVNGQYNAVAAVPKGIVRLRLLNGSNARIYTLHFNDRRALHLVATDGGFLRRAQELTYLRLAPGERAEVLVDFADGPAPVLMSASGLALRILEFAHDDRLAARIVRVPDGDIGGEDLGALPEGELRMRRFNLTMGGASTGGPVPGLPGPAGHGGHGAHAGHGTLIGLSTPGASLGTVMSDFAINGRSHDMRRIDFQVALGSTERWIVSGGAGVDHPFHVHGVHFRVVRVGGAEPRVEDSGWKDTVVVTGETEIVCRFDMRAGPDAPYMFHCHILEHEDAGMMGQFTVT